MASSPPASPPTARPLSAVFQSARTSSRLSINGKPGGGSRASDDENKTLVKVGECAGHQVCQHLNNCIFVQLSVCDHLSSLRIQASIWFLNVFSGPWFMLLLLQASLSILPKAANCSSSIKSSGKMHSRRRSGTIYMIASMPLSKASTSQFWPTDSLDLANHTQWALQVQRSKIVRISWVSQSSFPSPLTTNCTTLQRR